MNYDTMFFPKCLHFATVITWMSALGHFRCAQVFNIYIGVFYIYIIYILYIYKSAHFSNPDRVTATSLTLCVCVCIYILNMIL